MTTDEQLYKDIEGVLEQSCDMLRWQHQHAGHLNGDPQHLACMFEFWDGVCHLYTGKTKPSHWVSQLLKASKLFLPEARANAARKARTSSDVMSKARDLWRDLKAPKIKALFETADIASANGVESKRQRRNGNHRLDP